MADKINKKRGRPPMSPEMKAERTAKRSAATNAYHKSTGYAAQNKYRQSHIEQYRDYRKSLRGKTYEPKLRIPMDKKDALLRLMEQTGLTITQLCIGAVEEKYNIIPQFVNPIAKIYEKFFIPSFLSSKLNRSRADLKSKIPRG